MTVKSYVVKNTEDRSEFPYWGPIQGACLFVCSKYKEMYENIEESYIINLYQVLSMLKLKINVTLSQLLFQQLKMANLSDLAGFALNVTTCYKKTEITILYTAWDKGGKLIFDHSSAKPIFTQKLESPGFQIKHQVN